MPDKPILRRIYCFIGLLIIAAFLLFPYIIWNIYDLARDVRLEEYAYLQECARIEEDAADAAYQINSPKAHISPLNESRWEKAFTWEKIPGEDDQKLKNLISNYGFIENIGTARIVKSGDNNTTNIYTDFFSYSITLDNESNATLKISKFNLDTFRVKKENGEHNIYYKNIQNYSSDIHIGVYLDHIKDFSLKDSKWRADFYVWFAYSSLNKSKLEKDIDTEAPLLGFRLINTYVDDDNIKKVPHQLSNYEYCYYIYEIKNAEITEKFDTRLYPMDNQILAIRIESRNNSSIKYIADPHNFNLSSSINERVTLTGFNISHCDVNVSTDIYKTNFGDPYGINPGKINMPQYKFVLYAERKDKEILFLKIFLGLICAVAVSLIALFIKANNAGPRFGLGIGSLFAAVANNYIASSALPVAGIKTIIGLTHGAGIAIIFFTIAQSILSLYICKDIRSASFSKRFDKYSFGFLLVWLLLISFILYLSCFSDMWNFQIFPNHL